MICNTVPTQAQKRLKRPKKRQKRSLHMPCASGIKKSAAGVTLLRYAL